MTLHAKVEALQTRYGASEQEHVFTFLNELADNDKETFLAQLDAIDVAKVTQTAQRTLHSRHKSEASVDPLPQNVMTSLAQASSKVGAWRQRGLDLIAQSKVAVILMAGGQGTRLGSDQPKGCYDICLPSHKTLFQLQAERILRLQTLATVNKENKDSPAVIPWYIMTSGPTHVPTVAYFEANNYFGLEPSNVIFFQQGVMPCFTPEGKFMLQSKGKLAASPDGNGGIYGALHREGVIDSLVDRGIIYSHCYCVDNSLARVADPVFIGYCAERNTDCGVKVVSKERPEEPVGVVCLRNGKYGVMEYSEIPPALAQQRDETTGRLSFDAANIVNHLFSTAFLQRTSDFTDELEYHVARKNIPSIDLSTGEATKAKGIKLERFVFDVFPYAQAFSVLQVDRANEFSPLKNAPNTGIDCPETSRRDILLQHKAFIEQAGGHVAEGVEVEISPLVSYNGENLDAMRGKTIVRSVVAECLDDLLRATQQT